MQFVRRKRKGIDGRIREPNRNFSHDLDRIRMEQDAVSARDLRDFFHRKDDAGFIVGPHGGDDRSVWCDGALQFLQVEVPLGIDANRGHQAASFRKRVAMAPRRTVLDRGRDDMLSGRIQLQGGIYGRIIGLRAAARENDFARLTPKQGGQALPREIDRASHLCAEPVAARRIPEILGEKRQHFFDHGRIELRGRVVIEINDLLAGDHGK